jgi:RNA polymerase sigma factor (sigma-70 family)
VSAQARSRAASPDGELLNLYLAEIGRYPLLSAAEERRLGHIIERGQSARHELDHGVEVTELRSRQLRQMVVEADEATSRFVESNLRLVVSIAKRYQRCGLPLLDLVQEGNIGLIRAVARFDPRRGFRFSTFAAWAIRHAILRGIANSARLVRLPVHAGELVARVRRLKMLLEAERARRPTEEELAERLGIPLHRLQEVLLLADEPVSLAAPCADGDAELTSAIEDVRAVSPLDHAVLSMELETMSRAMATLDQAEYEVLRLRFGLDNAEPATLTEVGRRLELSDAAARSVQERAITKLRRSMKQLENVG